MRQQSSSTLPARSSEANDHKDQDSPFGGFFGIIVRMDFKEQFKSQIQKEKEPKVEVNDNRNHGLNRIYFFQRKRDGYIFPLDRELQASHLIRRKDFNEKYVYIGWSTGKYYNEYKKNGTTRVTYDEEANVSEEGKEKVEERRVTYNEMLEKELEEAVDNADHTPPRDFRVRDLNGSVQDSSVASMIKLVQR